MECSAQKYKVRSILQARSDVYWLWKNCDVDTIERELTIVASPLLIALKESLYGRNHC